MSSATSASGETIPARAVESHAAMKAAKYADQPNFVPFIVESGGYVNRQTHLFLDTLHPNPGHFRGPSPQVADIVVAIPA